MKAEQVLAEADNKLPQPVAPAINVTYSSERAHMHVAHLTSKLVKAHKEHTDLLNEIKKYSPNSFTFSNLVRDLEDATHRLIDARDIFIAMCESV